MNITNGSSNKNMKTLKAIIKKQELSYSESDGFINIEKFAKEVSEATIVSVMPGRGKEKDDMTNWIVLGWNKCTDVMSENYKKWIGK